MSLFVNPTQFGPGEDLDRYPRDEERDRAIAAEEGVDADLRPDVEEMYPAGILDPRSRPATWGAASRARTGPAISTGSPRSSSSSSTACGPTSRYFGQKDAQQLAVIRRMTADLDLGVEIRAVETVREPDGLALSSRNAYLSADERPTRRPRCTAPSSPATRAWSRGSVDYLAVVDRGHVSGGRSRGRAPS